MSMQTMNIHGVVSATVTKSELLAIKDHDRICYTQHYTFETDDGSTFEVTTFSDAPGVLKLADE